MKNYFQMLTYSIIVVFIASSCHSDKHYKTLSLFFDGVPNPADTQNSTTDTLRSGTDSSGVQLEPSELSLDKPVLSVHPVYKPNKCAQCHDVNHSYRLNQRQPELCYQCHQDFKEKYAKLHGPVAAGYCTACHSPHQSEFKYLLKHPARENCQYCHHAGDVAKNSAHEDISEIECMECHNPHGGEDKFFLN